MLLADPTTGRLHLNSLNSRRRASCRGTSRATTTPRWFCESAGCSESGQAARAGGGGGGPGGGGGGRRARRRVRACGRGGRGEGRRRRRPRRRGARLEPAV